MLTQKHNLEMNNLIGSYILYVYVYVLLQGQRLVRERPGLGCPYHVMFTGQHVGMFVVNAKKLAGQDKAGP